MKRLALSLLVAATCAGGFAGSSSAATNDATLYLWTGGDVTKSLGDRVTNINGGTGALTNSFGIVGGANGSIALGGSPIRFQAGVSYGVYDLKGRLRVVPNAYEPEKQVFATVGIGKASDMAKNKDPLSFGLVYDVFHAEQWGVNANTIDLAQIRGTFGFALNAGTEIGVWGTVTTRSDTAAVTVAGAPGVLSTIRSMNQANLYLKQTFAFGGQVTAYAGLLDKKSIGDWQFGLTGQAPLNANMSVYGNFNYVAPRAAKGPNGSGLEQFDVSFGVALALGNKTQSAKVGGLSNLPVLNVANNGSFLVTDAH